MTLWNVPGTGYAELIVNAGDGPTMVINRDETHQIFVGNDNSVASKQGTGDIDIIDPLSYIVYDGIQSKYAIADTPGIIVSVDCVKGATNWAPSPAQAAFQISQLGLATSANQNTQNNTAIATNNVLGSGIALPVGAAKETGNLLGIAQNAAFQTSYQGGTAASAFVANPGATVGHETAALIATGSPTGTPGGTPLLSGFSNTAISGPINIAAGGSGSNTYNITNPGYIISVSATYVANGTIPFAGFLMIWKDGSGNVIDQESWTIPVAAVGQTALVLGKGPTKGAQVTIRFLNHDPSQTITFNYNFNQTTHHIARDDWRQANGQGAGIVPGVSFAYPTNGNPLGNLIGASGSAGIAVGVNGSAVNLLALYAGQVEIACSSLAGNYTVNINPFDSNFPTGVAPIFSATVTPANPLSQGATLPRCPCQINIQNTNNTAGTVFFGITVLEFAS